MPNFAYVHCDIQGCGYHQTLPIVLPLPNPPETDPRQLLWPSGDWKAYLACPGCGQVLLRTAKDVQMMNSLSKQVQDSLKAKHWWRIEFLCEKPGCGVPMQSSFLGDTNDHPAAVLLEIQNKVRGKMACDHDFQVPISPHIEFDNYPIPPYDPEP